MIGWIPRRFLAISRGADSSPLGIYVPPLAGGDRHRYLSSGQVCLPQDILDIDCCVYKEVADCISYGLSEENSMLLRTGSSSFKYK